MISENHVLSLVSLVLDRGESTHMLDVPAKIVVDLKRIVPAIPVPVIIGTLPGEPSCGCFASVVSSRATVFDDRTLQPS
jgi:hypothetical protein